MRTFLATARFAAALLGTSVRATLALRGAFLLQMSFMALNNVVFFVFWWLLFTRVPAIRGTTLSDMALLFGLVATSFGCAVILGGGVHRLGRLIHEGELDAYLTQPKPALLYVVASQTRASGLGDVASGLGLIAFSGAIRPSAIPALCVAVFASALVLIASAVVYQSLAFWLGRTETASRQLGDALITFSLYPEPLFGGALRVALFSVLPAGFVGHLPARLVREPSLCAAAVLLGAAAAYVAVACWVFDRGLRSYRSGSRFSAFG